MTFSVRKLSNGQEMFVFTPSTENPYISRGVLVDCLDLQIPGISYAFTPSDGINRDGLWLEMAPEALSSASLPGFQPQNFPLDDEDFGGKPDSRTYAERCNQFISFVVKTCTKYFPFFSDTLVLTKFLQNFLEINQHTEKVVNYLLSCPWYKIIPLVKSNVVTNFEVAIGSGELDSEPAKLIFDIMKGCELTQAPNLVIKMSEMVRIQKTMASLFETSKQGVIQSLFAQRMLMSALSPILVYDADQVLFYLTEKGLQEVHMDEVVKILAEEVNPIQDYKFCVDSKKIEVAQVTFDSVEDQLGDW